MEALEWRFLINLARPKSDAIAYSIAETAKANSLNPYEQIKFVPICRLKRAALIFAGTGYDLNIIIKNIKNK